MALESLRYKRGEFSVIDQLKLPTELEYIPIKTSQDAWNVIRSMQVRGAPLIAIVAALGLAIEVNSKRSELSSVELASTFLLEQMVYLRTSRPTAVNLFVATDELSALVKANASELDATSVSVIDAYIVASENMLQIDVDTNKKIGYNGATRILEITGKEKIRVMTICNTGSLATAGYGTALGVVRSLHEMGKLEHVYACETRPYNQGARLTAFEIVQDKLPGTLITDSMASYLMAVKGVDCVVVGADRVAANGDTANKIGTYQLAIAAKYHGVPFFAAVPTTTLDLSMSNGSFIHVELRPEIELTSIFGQKIAPDGISAWNPSFDVTPCGLVRGIITEVGVAEASIDAGSDGIIDIPKFLRQKGMAEKAEKAAQPSSFPTAYVKMNEKSIGEYVVAITSLRSMLAATSAGDLEVSEVGDGNLNFVYIVKGPNGVAIVVKQALPYVRCVGESWPLTLERATFENNALVAQRACCPDYVPEVYLFDSSKAMIIMRFVEPPHEILRKALIAGKKITSFAEHLSTFLAQTLFTSSSLNLEGGALRVNISQWSRNTALCALTEQVIFTDPYHSSPMNRWTSPQLDSFVVAIKEDVVLKLAISDLKAKFLSQTESLLHGDLHTGSVMAKEGSTYVIDPEFAFYGPIGFDIGAVIANLLLSYFSQQARNGTDYAEWILGEMIRLYERFVSKFLSLWDEAAATGRGEAFKSSAFPAGSTALKEAQVRYMQKIFQDSIGFAAAKMIRRVVGIAHVEDLDSIDDADLRSACEKKSLVLARRMAVGSTDEFASLADVAAAARILFDGPTPQNFF